MFFDIIKAECASSEFLGGGWEVGAIRGCLVRLRV